MEKAGEISFIRYINLRHIGRLDEIKEHALVVAPSFMSSPQNPVRGRRKVNQLQIYNM